LNIVLVEPEIPANTGNIARTCAVTGSTLHLVRPLGFSTEDKYLKRAGLDYWNLVKIFYYDSIDELRTKYANYPFLFATKRAIKIYTEINYGPEAFLVFGKETEGLPLNLLRENEDCCIRIPMRSGVRSLNLSNAVAVVLYEALRQQQFYGLS